MSDDLFARCLAEQPCAFATPVRNAEHRERVELHHLKQWHGLAEPETDEACDALLAAHPADMALVVQAIEACARVNAGIVDQNVVRQLLANDPVMPQIVGPTYKRLKKEGRLVKHGTNISDDKKGGNAGKPQVVYRLVEVRQGASA
jgi:hypothetical protein